MNRRATPHTISFSSQPMICPHPFPACVADGGGGVSQPDRLQFSTPYYKKVSFRCPLPCTFLFFFPGRRLSLPSSCHVLRSLGLQRSVLLRTHTPLWLSPCLPFGKLFSPAVRKGNLGSHLSTAPPHSPARVFRGSFSRYYKVPFFFRGERGRLPPSADEVPPVDPSAFFSNAFGTGSSIAYPLLPPRGLHRCSVLVEISRTHPPNKKKVITLFSISLLSPRKVRDTLA